MDDRKTVISTMAPLPPTDNCKSIPVSVNESENIEDRLTSPREVAPSKPASHFSNHEGQFTKPPYAKQPDGNCDGGPYCNTFAPLPNVSIANHRYRKVTLQTRGFDSLSSAQQNQLTQNERNDHFHRYVPESWTESMTFVPERCDSSTQGGRNNNRGRTTYSDDQIAELEKVFSRNAYPTPQARHQLAQDISVPEGKVKIWFQNRRARAKKQRIIANNGWRLGL
uniref:Homeobox domain-containing protein n=1 Tax=Ciona savignyi TaxID=51511 RepID=H2ZJE4_CIOSA